MSKLTDILKSVAPVLAGALGTLAGGPVAGAAVKVLSERLLGRPDGTQAEVEAAVSAATPDQLLALRQADNAFKTRMVELGFKPMEMEFEDRQDARARDVEFLKAGKRNERGDLLAYFAVGGLMVLALVVFMVDLSQDQKEICLFVLGVLSGVVKDVYNFEFSSSKDAAKSANFIQEQLK